MNNNSGYRFFAMLTAACLFALCAQGQASYAQQLADNLPPLPKTKSQDDEKKQDSAAKSGDSKETESDDSNESNRTSRSSRIRPYSTNSDDVLAPFYSIVAEPAKSTVTILNGRRRIAMGTIIDSSGLILTKASELKGDLKCELIDGRKLDATVFGVHKQTDLALIKVESENLAAVELSEIDSPISGSWLVTPDADVKPMAIGVVSVEPRLIRHNPGYMGVRFVMTESRPTIESVDNDTPAERAGIKAGDIITKVDGEETKDRPALIRKVQSYRPGDYVTVTVLREEKEIDLGVTLGNSLTLNPNNDRRNMQNRMGSRNSRRNDDFPLAFQHDTPLTRDQIGGSVLDIDGNVVGINIARQGRVSTLALPVSIVAPVIAELRSGSLSPAIVNKARLEQIDKQLEDIARSMKVLPRKKERWEGTFQDKNAREEELQKIFDDLKKRLDEIKKDRENAKNELDDIKDEMRNNVKNKERLEREREQLMFDGN